MKPRDILHSHKRKAKHLLSPKSYNDLTAMAASSAASNDAMLGGPADPSVRRSHSFGSGFSLAAANRIALGAEHPHSADAYELINKCGHGATAEVSGAGFGTKLVIQDSRSCFEMYMVLCGWKLIVKLPLHWPRISFAVCMVKRTAWLLTCSDLHD